MQSHAAAEFLCPECERVFAGGDERCPYDGTRLVNLGAGLAPGTVIDQRYDSVEGGPRLDTYRQPFAFQAPRSVRFGIRYSF